jgi:putative ABC transport system permease protein
VIRVALQMLLGDRAKYVGVVFGVFFASLLVTLLLSMFWGILTRTYALIQDVGQADVWVMDPAVEYVEEIAPLSATALQRTRGVEGVRWALPLYAGGLRARLPSGRFKSVQVVGIDDATLTGAPPEIVEGRLEDLRATDAVIVDEVSAETTLRQPVTPPGPVRRPVTAGPTRPLRVGDTLLINDQRVVVAGISRVAQRFIEKPTIYASYSRATTLAPPERNLMSFVLVKARDPGAAATLARRIEDLTGLKARTNVEFRRDTMWWFIRNTGIVPQVGMMVGLGVVVGFAIAGQLLYMFTHDNLRQYAALMAMGAGPADVVRMVVVQALACGATGYGLGLGAAALIGNLTTRHAIPFRMAWQTPVAVGLMVLLICVAAAALSTLKVLRSEPGLVFRP